MVEMRRIVPLLAFFFVAGVAFAQTPPARGPCQAVDALNLSDPDRPDVLFTTPPYVALTSSGKLRRLASRTRPLRRDVPLSDEQATCLEALTGTRLSAVRTGSSYRYKLQTSTGTLLIFHVADLVGGEAIVPTQVERLLANAERFLKEGNRTETARAYHEVLKVNPRPVEAAMAHTALGRMDKEDGRREEALNHFRNAVEANPHYVPALEESAALALEMEQPKEARKAYEALRKLVPNRPGPYVALIQLAQKRKDQKEMARLFQKLQAVDRNAASRVSREIPDLRGLSSERQGPRRGLEGLQEDVKKRPLKLALNKYNPEYWIDRLEFTPQQRKEAEDLAERVGLARCGRKVIELRRKYNQDKPYDDSDKSIEDYKAFTLEYYRKYHFDCQQRRAEFLKKFPRVMTPKQKAAYKALLKAIPDVPYLTQ
jgi:tetratricopeptide (TPR) repeat protein